MLVSTLLLAAILGGASSVVASTGANKSPEFLPELRSWEFQPASEAWEQEILREDAGGVELEIRVNRLTAEAVEAGWQCRIPGTGTLLDPGHPELPFWSGLFALPSQAGVGIEILAEEIEELSLGQLPPAPDWESDYPEAAPPAREADPAIYGQDAFWPATGARLGDPALWHGVRMAPLDIFPLSWNPATGRLKVRTLLRVRLSFQGEDFRNTRPGVRPLSPLASKLVLPELVNPATAQAEAARLDPQSELNLGHYFVIYPENALPYLQPWIDWKRQMGYRVRMLTREEIGNSVTFAQVQTQVELEYQSQGIDYLVLVGDMDSSPGLYHMPSNLIQGGHYAETFFGGDIVSDHEYSLQEGDDYFPDLLVGRLSVDTRQQLNTLMSKLVTYEKNPHDPGVNDWYNNAGMVYDIAQAGSRRETMYAVSHILEDLGFDQFTFIENDLWNNPLSPTVVTSMINSGVSFVNYRGYGYRYQWAGPNFGVSQINNDLTNFQAWPFVTSIVCGGGDFGSHDSDPCLGEAFLRAANGPSPKGAIGFVGPSELDTHTKWNNAISTGIYQGLAHEGITQLGALMNYGKLELWEQFPNARIPDWSIDGAGNCVPHYFHTYNLLGDPGLHVWSAAPRDILVDVNTELASGMRQLAVHVEDATMGSPLQEAVVYVYDAASRSGELGHTDEQGNVVLDLGALEAGELVLTVHGPGLRPIQGAIEVLDQATAPALEDWSLSDGGDNLPGPGEVLELQLQIGEAGNEGSAEPRALSIVSQSSLLQVLQGEAELGATSPGESIAITEGLQVAVAPWALDGAEGALDLYLEEEWLARLEFTIAAPSWQVTDVEILSGELQPGATLEFRLALSLNELVDMPELPARLLVDHGGAQLINDGCTIPAMPSGTSDTSGSFELQLDEEMLPGTQVGCWIQFLQDDQVIAETAFPLVVGTPGLEDPQGPDAGGYVIYHSDDTGYEAAPVHLWQDISEMGTSLEISDQQSSSWNGGVDGISELINLPFAFTFYGESWNVATVNSNGWLAMGEQLDYISARNTGIPGAQGPPGMISVYWTDLINSTGFDDFGQIYTWHDTDQQQFVIQWTNFRHAGNIGSEDFQIILRDPAHWPTPGGNGEILFVYEDVIPNIGDDRVTVGIENYTQTSGLEYTFNNEYCTACQAIMDNTTLLITEAPYFESTGLQDPGMARAQDFRLLGIAPNPFNPSTRVSFELGTPRAIRWALYDLRGRRIHEGALGTLGEGSHSFRLDGQSRASGVYLLQLQEEDSGRSLARRKLLLLK